MNNLDLRLIGKYHRRKSLLEIELNENLRRKRNELEGRIEMLLDAPLGENEDATNIDTKTRELDALNASIDRLRRELQGAPGSASRVKSR